MEENFTNDMERIWNAFIMQVEQSIDSLYKLQKEYEERLAIISNDEELIQNCQYYSAIILAHKDEFPDLGEQIYIFEECEENNLDDSYAEECLLDNRVREALTNLFIKEKEQIDKKIEMFSHVSDDMDLDAIEKYCDEYNFDVDSKKKLIEYLVFKSFEKKINSIQEIESGPEPVIDNAEIEHIPVEGEQQTISFPKAPSLDDAQAIEKEEQQIETLTDVDNSDKEKTFNQLISLYNIVSWNINMFTNKYSEYWNDYYRNLASLSTEYLPDLNLSDKDKAIVLSIKLFNNNEEIKTIPFNIEYNDYLKYYILECRDLIIELLEVDKRLEDMSREPEALDNSKVYFLTDVDGQPFIPDTEEAKKQLRVFIEKANGDSFYSRRISVKKLKANEPLEYYTDARTVFLYENNNIRISYVMINPDESENNNGVLVITAIPQKSDNIGQITTKVLRKTEGSIIGQIEAIERKDENQMELQSKIISDILQSRAKGENSFGGRV